MMMGRRMIDCEKREAAVCGTLWQEVTLDRGRTLLGHNHHYSFIHPCHRSNSHRHHRWSCFWVVFKRVCQQLGQLSIKNCEDHCQAPIYKVTLNTRTYITAISNIPMKSLSDPSLIIALPRPSLSHSVSAHRNFNSWICQNCFMAHGNVPPSIK